VIVRNSHYKAAKVKNPFAPIDSEAQLPQVRSKVYQFKLSKFQPRLEIESTRTNLIDMRSSVRSVQHGKEEPYQGWVYRMIDELNMGDHADTTPLPFPVFARR
jgi:hypothetical protein